VPYYITNQSRDCPRWAVVKASGSAVACHESKSSAIKQMVALSVAEGIEPGGEWKKDD
jgi:hypothetical protein